MDNKLVEKILALDEIEGLTVADYADKVRDLVNDYTPDPEHNFPNGFENWHEVHYQVCDRLFPILASDEDTWPERLQKIHNSEGTGGVMALAREITDKFELKNKDREWDGEWLGEVEAFVESELNLPETHEKDNQPFGLTFRGKKYPAREVYHKEENKFLIVTTGDYYNAFVSVRDSYTDQETIDYESVNWFADEEDFLKTDEELINIIFA